MWVAIKRSSLALAVSLLLSPVAQAAESYKVLPSLSWSLDQVLDLANTDITGLTVAASTLDCSLYGNGGKITTDPAHVGAFICAADTGTGSAANSFETIAVPAGTSPVADSATDTLTLTETSFLTLTGTAGTDTIDITQVTTDLGTDGLIAANAVALSTDTTGNYVASVGDCTASEGSVPFAGACGTTLTPSAGTLTVAGDLLVTTSGANLGVQDTAGTAFNWHAGPTYSWFSDGDTRFLLMDGAANTLTLGDQGSQIANLKVFTSGNSILTGGLVVDTTTLVANATTNQVILGQAAALDPFSATPVLSLRTNTAAGTSMELQGIGGGDGPGLTGFTSNGSVTSPTDSSTGHVMLALNGVMRAGGDWAYEPVAALKMLVDGAVGVDDFPTRLELYTTPNGTPDPIRRLLIEEDGQTLLNASTDTSRSIISGPVLGSGFQIQSEGGTNSDLSFVTAGLSGSDADLIWLSSNGTLDTRTIVVDQDIIGAIGFAGYDGADYERCALIEGNIGRADGTAVTPASNDMPMYLELSTCADNSNSRTVRMLLDETGISVGNSTGARLWHDGDGALEITGQGNGTDECLALNLDDTSNVADFTNCASSTGVTTVQLTNLDFLVTGTGPNLGVQETSGTAFNWHGGANQSWFSDSNADVRYVGFDGAANRLLLGENGAPLTRLDVFTDSTGNGEVNLPTDSIGATEVMGGLSKCASVENLAAADDNMPLGSVNVAATVVNVWCHCYGTCTTPATIQLEDDAGAAMTGTATCDTGGGAATPTNISAGGAVVAYEGIRFDTTNAVSPETDEYAICFGY